MQPDQNTDQGTDGPLISIRRLIKTRPGKTPYCLKVARLDVKRRDRTALVGQSGSGKSTLLDMLALVLRPDMLDKGGEFIWRKGSPSGRLDIWRDWQSARSSRRERIRRQDLGYVLQSGGLLPFLTVADNIVLPAQLKGSPRGRALDDRLHHLAEHLGISRLLKKLPSAISVGERQRSAVARALIHSPPLLLADEPTASLDPPTAETVFELFLELAEETESAIVLATHNREQAEKFGFRLHTVDCVDRRGAVVARLLEPPPGGGPDPQGGLVVVKESPAGTPPQPGPAGPGEGI
jgi:putative ABC transport system ATP-binding protein